MADLEDRTRRQRPALSLLRHRLNPRQAVAARHKVAGYTVFVFRGTYCRSNFVACERLLEKLGKFSKFDVRKRTVAKFLSAMTEACTSAAGAA